MSKHLSISIPQLNLLRLVGKSNKPYQLNGHERRTACWWFDRGFMAFIGPHWSVSLTVKGKEAYKEIFSE